MSNPIQVTPKHGHKKMEHHKNGKNIQKPKESNVKQKGFCVWLAVREQLFFFLFSFERVGVAMEQ